MFRAVLYVTVEALHDRMYNRECYCWIDLAECFKHAPWVCRTLFSWLNSSLNVNSTVCTKLGHSPRSPSLVHTEESFPACTSLLHTCTVGRSIEGQHSMLYTQRFAVALRPSLLINLVPYYKYCVHIRRKHTRKTNAFSLVVRDSSGYFHCTYIFIQSLLDIEG